MANSQLGQETEQAIPRAKHSAPETPRPRYQFSANRTHGRHRVRYVETSQQSDECTLCELAQ
ncbi:hypothetical protein K0J45_18105 [Shewanella alkalitolerans]|uniref:hypothetical protein n=1 Tax=Shewanella alkalitolerans TaxID=2864209 RepID=UPI001C658E3A|nr:hypothetical protein [Shewanella alkalitolerans]QYJ97386.1 hypothetical protein K0J45_18105 [Shewanella alkalitolerans]